MEFTSLLESRSKEFPTERADCVVRAMSIALHMDYKDAHAFLKKNGRQDRKGTYTESMLMGLQRARTIKGRLLVQRKMSKGMTLKKFLDKNPTGRFICLKSGHAFAVIDGKVYGQSNGCIITRYITVKLNESI